jgi:hypothetical protein
LIAGDKRFERRRLVFRLLTVGVATLILHTAGRWWTREFESKKRSAGPDGHW